MYRCARLCVYVCMYVCRGDIKMQVFPVSLVSVLHINSRLRKKKMK